MASEDNTHRKRPMPPMPIVDSSSSSESDIENYLQKPQDLNLNSTFFQTNSQTEKCSPIIQSSYQAGANLSDTDSDEPLSCYQNENDNHDKCKIADALNLPSTSKVPVETSAGHKIFSELNQQAIEFEEAKKQIEAYLARKQAEHSNQTNEVDKLLAAGERSYDLVKDLADVGFHPSDFESGSASEKEDWQEVEGATEENIIPKDGVQITVELPNVVKKKKGIDIIAMLKRRMNRIKKENQVYIHKVHLLAWIAHGNYVNEVLNRDSIKALAVSVLPNKNCYPPGRTNLKYLEQITTWYHKAIKYNPEMDEKHKKKVYDLEEIIMKQTGDKVATNANIFVYIFIAMLRALGLQCRMVLSLQVEPLRPPASELCSLKNEKEESSKSKTQQTASAKNKKVENKKSMVIDKSVKAKSKSTSSLPAMKKDDAKPSDTLKKKDQKKPSSAPKSEKDTLKIPANNVVRRTKSTSNSADTKNTKISSRADSGEVPLPVVRKSTREKRVTKSKLEQSIDDELKMLEDLEKPAGSKPNLTKLKSFSTTDDEDVSVVRNLCKDSTSHHRSKVINKPERMSTNGKNVTKKSKSSLPPTLSPQNKKMASTSKVSLNSSITEDEDDFLDRSSWRRWKQEREDLKSTKGTDARKSSDKTERVENVSSRPRRTIKRPSPPPSTKDAVDSDKNEIPKKIKMRIPKKKLPQVDGEFNESTSDSECDNVMQVDGAEDKKTKPILESRKDSRRLKSLSKSNSSDSEPKRSTPNLGKLKSPSNSTEKSKTRPDKSDVTEIIVDLVRSNLRSRVRSSKSSYEDADIEDSDEDDEFVPSPKKKKQAAVKVKRRVLPRSQIEALAKEKAEAAKSKGIDIWVEVFLEEEEKWICADVISGKVHCIKDVCNKASHPISYVLSWDNTSRIKDITKRYCQNWNTITRKLRVDPKWWEASLRSFVGVKTARDREEDEDLARQELDQPLPKTIGEYKDHPLYVLKRHLLKFQALYPPDAAVLGFIRGEEVYSRGCVYVLHSRDIWLKEAKVVRPGEQPYKIVKARPKWDKLSNAMITDQLLEIFGHWQVQDYDPPTAENGVVPRNAYGNVELFKATMLPKKCVHLQLPGLNKIARKLQIDCAPAVVGFDFHGGWNHAVYDGFIVCEEFKDTLISAWEQEQDEIVKREQEKYEKRVFGNWRRLIKAAMIRERLKARYDFTSDKKLTLDEDDLKEELPLPSPPKEEKEESPPKKKRPKFMSRK